MEVELPRLPWLGWPIFAGVNEVLRNPHANWSTLAVIFEAYT